MKKRITLSVLFVFATIIGSGIMAQWSTATTPSNYVWLDPSGYSVGIGTPYPTAKLEINTPDTRTKPLVVNTNNSGAFAVYANRGVSVGSSATNPPATGLYVVGNVGIGIASPGTKLDVAGTIRAYELKVCLNQGCDFVFEEDYDLMPINDLNTFIKTNKHLPQVAPAAVMESEGINVSEMNALLLQKIEELTLYMIQQQQEIDELRTMLK